MTLHDVGFPGESDQYRRERNRLLEVEIEVRQTIERVAAQRRALPLRSDDERLIRFEAVGDGEDFVADVVFDADGLVLDYPGIATRIRATDGRA